MTTSSLCWAIKDILRDFPVLILVVLVIALPLSANKNFPFSCQCIQLSSVSPAFSMQQVIHVWVRDPRIRKNDFWHAYIDYEICLHVSKMIKGSCFNLYNGIAGSAVICVPHLCPVLDRQCVLHQENLECEKEVQWVCMAKAKTTSKFTTNVSSFTVYWEIPRVKTTEHIYFQFSFWK